MRVLLIAGGLSLLFTLVLTPLFIKLFVKLAWRQFIRDDGPESHHVKRGTPTMGGIVFILGAIFGYVGASLLTGQPMNYTAVLVLFMLVGQGAVGFIDDFLKTHRKQSLGLGGWPKVSGQVGVAAVFALLALNHPNAAGVTAASLRISFVRDTVLNFMVAGTIVGIILYVLWICLITVSATNGVNVTDGLDGLAAGATILAIGSFVVIGFWQFNQACGNIDTVLNVAKCYNSRDPLDIAVVAASITGGLIGFLWWNTNPARIYMGDTGSLALGGALAALAIVSRTELLLVFLGGLFAVEAGSVVVQRAYFKITGGKRIFRMSPIHHHFELKGWAEVTVVVRFWIIAGLLVSLGVGLFYLEWLQR